MEDSQPLYNSRITKIYIQYLRRYYPEIDIESVLKETGIASYEVEDPAHWFSQEQIDRFNEVLVARTGDANIARHAGRFASSSDGIGATKQYVLGLMTPSAIYTLMEKLYPLLSRAADIKAQKMGHQSVEIVSTPAKDVKEKSFQCEYRIGFFEALAKPFTDHYAQIDHPECLHKGGNCCRYIIRWHETTQYFWKRVRNYLLISSAAVLVLLFFFLSHFEWLFVTLIGAFLNIFITYYIERLENKSLRKTIEDQKNAAQDHLVESNIRYNNALLIQEIGQATTKITDSEKIIEKVINVMARRLHFDRGMIMLVNEQKTRLVFKGGYGHTKQQEELIRNIEFHLDNPNSRGIFVRTVKQQKPFLIDNLSELMNDFSSRSKEISRKLGSQSVICVPIVYEKESLGILAVDNLHSHTTLRKSDLNLLMGVASETAISLVNAKSFKKIKESEARYRFLADNISDVIWIADLADFRFRYVSSSVQRMQGYTPDEYIKLSLRDILLDASFKYLQSVFSLQLKREKTGPLDPLRSWIFELEHYRKDGSTFWVEVTARFLNDQSGKATRVLGVSRDISERKKAEIEKKSLEVKLQQAHKMEAIGTLAGGIAHDFNNILYIINGYAELALKQSDTHPAVKSKLENILKAGDRAKTLVKQILSFSRQEAVEKKPIMVHLIVKEALKFIRSSIPTTIQIQQEIISDSKILADPVQIHQILMNLCTNAEHAMAETGGVLKVSLFDTVLDDDFVKGNPILQSGPFICLSVSDTGQGISVDQKNRIFDPFYTTKAPGVGTGLGLAVVHGIVSKHGGAIMVESELGKGSVFNIYLPIVDGQSLSEVELVEEPPGGKERILFIDDDASLATMGKEMLEVLGYQVVACSNSKEAMEIFKSDPNKFDLIITDMTMPGLTGDRLAIEAMNLRPDLPVILMSGFSKHINEEAAKKIGIKEFIMKPISLQKIATAIRSAIDQDEAPCFSKELEI
jgi:PAS domain S-box-containing protein